MAEPADEHGDMTIEQLATWAELPYSTIRMYQQKGLIPPPERRGRVGFYNGDHRARLRLIAELQERGYSLAAIKDLIDTWQQGRSLGDVLGVEQSAAGVLRAGEPLRLTPAELVSRFEGLEIGPDLVTRAVAMGLAELDGDAIVINAPVFLDVGAELVRMGVPVDEVLDEWAHLKAATDEVADRFGGVFERNVWAPFAEAGMPGDQVPELTAALERLGPLAEEIVTATLRQSLAAVAAGFLDRQAQALSTTPPKTKAKTKAARATTRTRKATTPSRRAH